MKSSHIVLLDTAIGGYEISLEAVGGPRLSYFVDGDIAGAQLLAKSAVAQFERSAPELERPVLADAERRIRGPEDDAEREAFLAVHQGNIVALKAFRGLAAESPE